MHNAQHFWPILIRHEFGSPIELKVPCTKFQQKSVPWESHSFMRTNGYKKVILLALSNCFSKHAKKKTDYDYAKSTHLASDTCRQWTLMNPWAPQKYYGLWISHPKLKKKKKKTTVWYFLIIVASKILAWPSKTGHARCVSNRIQHITDE